MARIPVAVATWRFGKEAVEDAARVLRGGGNALDAVEAGIRVVEADPDVDTVGLGGAPNSEGVVELDAALMDGATCRAGAVAALRDILHPISVARKVMEETSHVLLAGEGALRFALEQGFRRQDLTTEKSRRKWREWKQARCHDTIGLVVLDGDGNLAAGCSTSGWAYKLPGRVGDSPIVGAGLYADNEVGAAAATGRGEDIMRYCSCFLVVEYMRQGLPPQEACLAVLRRIYEREGGKVQLCLIALDKEGRYGTAGMKKGFPYAVHLEGRSLLLEAPYLVETRG